MNCKKCIVTFGNLGYRLIHTQAETEEVVRTLITDPIRLGLSGSLESSIVIRGTSRLTLSLQNKMK